MPTSPQRRLAIELFDFSNEFSEASLRLLQKKPFISHPTFYCALHAIELGLKAHLAYAGVTKKALMSRALGHDLPALVKKVDELGMLNTLGLSAIEIDMIKRGTKGYAKKDFEYPEYSSPTFGITNWQTAADQLIRAFRKRLHNDGITLQ